MSSKHHPYLWNCVITSLIVVLLAIGNTSSAVLAQDLRKTVNDPVIHKIKDADENHEVDKLPNHVYRKNKKINQNENEKFNLIDHNFPGDKFQQKAYDGKHHHNGKGLFILLIAVAGAAAVAGYAASRDNKTQSFSMAKLPRGPIPKF